MLKSEAVEFFEPYIVVNGHKNGNGSSGSEISKILKEFDPEVAEPPYAGDFLEYSSPIGEEKRLALVDHMVRLGDYGKFLFTSSMNLAYINEHGSTHRALDRMYRGPIEEIEPDREHYLWSRLFIENIHNAQALRNRRKKVEKMFREHHSKSSGGANGLVEVLSVGAGSNYGMMRVLAGLGGEGLMRTRLTLVDISGEAMADAECLSSEFGVRSAVNLIQENALQVPRYTKKLDPLDTVEIVGLLDYFRKDETIINMLRRLRERMRLGGIMIYSNIAENDEMDFTHKIVGWPEMIYRSADQVQNLAVKAGFAPNQIVLEPEPLGVYNLVVAKA